MFAFYSFYSFYNFENERACWFIYSYRYYFWFSRFIRFRYLLWTYILIIFQVRACKPCKWVHSKWSFGVFPPLPCLQYVDGRCGGDVEWLDRIRKNMSPMHCHAHQQLQCLAKSTHFLFIVSIDSVKQ